MLHLGIILFRGMNLPLGDVLMPLLDVPYLSAWLNVKPGTLYHWVSHGVIPHMRLNGVIRFSKEDIKDWLVSSRAHKPQPLRKEGHRGSSS